LQPAAADAIMSRRVVGVVKCIHLGRPLRAVGRLSAFLLFAVMQFSAMWVSFLRPIANR
jgi:hypothetical protein